MHARLESSRRTRVRAQGATVASSSHGIGSSTAMRRRAANRAAYARRDRSAARRVKPSRQILQFLEHLLHVGKPKLAGIVLPQRMELARGDLIPLDAVRLSMK